MQGSADPAVASLAESVILYHGGPVELNLQEALRVADSCALSSANCKVVVFIAGRKIKEGCDPEGIFRALELVDVCVRNNGLVFARHIDSSFMRGLSKLLKLTTFKRSLSKDVRDKINKFLGGGSSINPGVATDPRIHRLKRRVLYLLQVWHDSFVLYQDELPAIFGAYRKLRCGGVEFPVVDPSQRFLVKNAEGSPALDPAVRGVPPTKATAEDPRSLISAMREALSVLSSPPGKVSASQEASALNVLKTKRPALRSAVLELSGSDVSLEKNLRLVALALEVLDKADGFLQTKTKPPNRGSAAAAERSDRPSLRRESPCRTLDDQPKNQTNPEGAAAASSSSPPPQKASLPSENLLDFFCAFPEERSGPAASSSKAAAVSAPSSSLEMDLLELNSAFATAAAPPTALPCPFPAEALKAKTGGSETHAENFGSAVEAKKEKEAKEEKEGVSPLPLVNPWEGGEATFSDFVSPPLPAFPSWPLSSPPKNNGAPSSQNAEGPPALETETKAAAAAFEEFPLARKENGFQPLPAETGKARCSEGQLAAKDSLKAPSEEDPFAECLFATGVKQSASPSPQAPALPPAESEASPTQTCDQLGGAGGGEEKSASAKKGLEGVPTEGAEIEASSLAEVVVGSEEAAARPSSPVVEQALPRSRGEGTASADGVASAPSSPSSASCSGHSKLGEEALGSDSPNNNVVFEDVLRKLDELTQDCSLSYL